ncbi:universal stress protein [Pararhodonellum marinum]|uniref:universal stress protein n=1 Tax=Pararhodonellum marinum TaxID=2755358 RepID=UPI00188E85E2|nr:universal stress protein [Pararhodonellum marinum]
MKRIIVPIDFSSYANHAFDTAVKIASKKEASITCLNVISSGLDWKNMSKAEKSKHQDILDQEAEATDKLKAFVLDKKIKNVPIETLVDIGVPSDKILETAARQKAELIVIGAYGRGHQEGKFIGSNLQKVMRGADCAILAVKKTMMAKDFRKMAFASLFTESSKPAFTRMLPIIHDLGTSVHFVYINSPSHFQNSAKIRTMMKDFSKGLKDLVIHQHVYNHDDAENGIIQFCEENKIGYVGIASGNRKKSSSYQIGVTETVLFKSDLPVLSVKSEI